MFKKIFIITGESSGDKIGSLKFAKDDLDKQSKEDIFTNIDDMLSETLNQKDN